MAACLKKEPRSGRGYQAREDIWPFIQQLAMTRADRLAGRASSAVKASVNQPTQALKKSRYIQIRGRNRRRYCIQPREGTMPASHEILICAALTTGLLLQGSSCFGDD